MKLREKAETMKKGGHTVMHTICLKDNWTLTVLGKNVYDIPETPIETKVPSTVYGTLLEKDLIPDPFYRDNEARCTEIDGERFRIRDNDRDQ